MSSPAAARLDWIGLRPAPRAPVEPVDAARAEPEQGLVGDRFRGRPGGAGTRQVTLVSAEQLAEAARRLGRAAPLDPAALRRNLLVSGLDFAALRGRRLQVGPEVELEITGGCPPCERMDENLGPGGRAALDGLGGLTARVLRGGTLRVGDAVTLAAGERAPTRA